MLGRLDLISNESIKKDSGFLGPESFYVLRILSNLLSKFFKTLLILFTKICFLNSINLLIFIPMKSHSRCQCVHQYNVVVVEGK